jgi:DNA-binding CsgD family transcriptional regulator
VAELRVCRLAQQGVRAQQIADQLFLSVHTIQSHLQHIYDKLHVRSQRELMALAPQEPVAAGRAAGPSRER